jgi:hypothetical protein
VGVRPLLAAATAVLLCGCEVYAVPDPPPCPGTRQGIFDWGGTLIVNPPSDCFFAQPGNPAFQVNSQIAFQGAVNFGPGADEARVCIEQAHAQNRVGTYQPGVLGNGTVDIRVSYLGGSGSVGGYTCPSQEAADENKCLCSPGDLTACSCPVIIAETITGYLTPRDPADPSRGYVSFTGLQIVDVTPPPGPAPSQPCTPRADCSYTYDLAASETGAR